MAVFFFLAFVFASFLRIYSEREKVTARLFGFLGFFLSVCLGFFVCLIPCSLADLFIDLSIYLLTD